MISKSQYKIKIDLLSPFLEELCKGIKKEIRQEFIQKGLFKKSESNVEWKEVAQFFYKKIVEEGDENVGEWLASSWVCKNGEIFQHFHEELSLIDKQYENLVGIPLELEQKIKDLSVSKFGFLRVYLFCVLNSVVFSSEVFESLRKAALEEVSSSKESLEAARKISSVEELEKVFELEKKKIEEKYEKRMQGVLKKYQIEVDGYRKQIGQLQKKLEKLHV